MASELGKFLRAARKKKDMGLRELARTIKKSPAVLTRLENEDDVPAVSPDTLRAIAEALDLVVDQVLLLAKRTEELAPRTQLEIALYRRFKDLRKADQKQLLKDLEQRYQKFRQMGNVGINEG